MTGRETHRIGLNKGNRGTDAFAPQTGEKGEERRSVNVTDVSSEIETTTIKQRREMHVEAVSRGSARAPK